ncbi:hypothetical protein JY469_17850 [Serratia marcescens]|nr:hypothetical protein [Serratia marcescens]
MRCVLALSASVLVVLLAACGEQPADNLVDALAADTVRFKSLRTQCAANPQQIVHATNEGACRAAAGAFRRRFFSCQSGPDEYQTPADLLPIPPSFEEPVESDDISAASALPSELENAP